MLAHLRTSNIYKRTYGTTRFSMMHEEAKRRKLELTMMYNKKEIEISHGPRNDDPKTRTQKQLRNVSGVTNSSSFWWIVLSGYLSRREYMLMKLRTMKEQQCL